MPTPEQIRRTLTHIGYERLVTALVDERLRQNQRPAPIPAPRPGGRP